jgi:hypothetical protein
VHRAACPTGTESPSIVLSQAAFDRIFPQPQDQYAFVNVTGAPTAATTAQLQRALTAYPDTAITPKANWVRQQANVVNQILDLFYVPARPLGGRQPVRNRQHARARRFRT